MKKNVKLLNLFLSFFKIGLFTFGGGLAMMPLMRRDIVVSKGWTTDEDMLQMLVISESTPGVLAVNAATYIGYKLRGLWGSLVATIGVVLPSFIIGILISIFFMRYMNNIWVRYAFNGVQVGVSILIIRAAIKLGKKVEFNWFAWVVLIASFIALFLLRIHVLIIILIAAVSGLLYGFLHQLKEVKQDD